MPTSCLLFRPTGAATRCTNYTNAAINGSHAKLGKPTLVPPLNRPAFAGDRRCVEMADVQCARDGFFPVREERSQRIAIRIGIAVSRRTLDATTSIHLVFRV